MYASVDPELVPYLEASLVNQPHVEGLSRYRGTEPAVHADVSEHLSVTEMWIPGLKFGLHVHIFVIGAGLGETRPALLHIHGGGYVAGSAADSLPALLQLSQRHECVVVTVDYRLAPEVAFPGALDDNQAALYWLYHNARALGVDRGRIVVAGESAGGGHAAMLTIADRDTGANIIQAQILTYPMLDDRTGSSRAVPEHIGQFIWRPQDNRFGWSALLGQPAGRATVPPGSVPGRLERLQNLPPTFIGVGSIDLFVTENLEFATRLVDSGVPTEIYVVPGAYHGFDILVPDAEVSTRFRSVVDGALCRAFHKRKTA